MRPNAGCTACLVFHRALLWQEIHFIWHKRSLTIVRRTIQELTPFFFTQAVSLFYLFSQSVIIPFPSTIYQLISPRYLGSSSFSSPCKVQFGYFHYVSVIIIYLLYVIKPFYQFFIVPILFLISSFWIPCVHTTL